MVKSFIICSIIMLCFVLAEASILSNVMILPAVPDFVLMCTVYLSLLNGRGFGSAYGFISGIFLDFLSGVPLGFNCLFRTLIGYAAGFAGTSLNYTGFFIPAFIGFCATFSKVFLVRLMGLFYPAISIKYDIMSSAFIFELAANTILTPFLFKFLFSFRKMICLNPEE